MEQCVHEHDQGQPRGGDNCESSTPDSWMPLRLLAWREAGIDFIVQFLFVQQRLTIHLLRKWTVLSGELKKKFCSGLKGIMITESSKGKIAHWFSVKAMAGGKRLDGMASQHGQRIEREAEARGGG